MDDAVPPRVAAVIAAAQRGDAEGAAQAAAKIADLPLTFRAVSIVLDAALNLGDARFVRATTGLALGNAFAATVHINFAWRLAQLGYVEDALALLLTHPEILQSEGMTRRAIAVLQQVRARSPRASLPAAQAQALLRRLIQTGDPPWVAAPHAFPDAPASDSTTLMPLPRVRYAANVSELLRKDTEAALQSLERIVKASPAPTVRQLHDVYVNRQGQVWNREATLYIACNSAVPKASRAAESKAPVLDAAVLAIEPHNNIYHWMVEYLPALAWRLDASALDIPVLIRDDAPPFVASTLELAAARPLSITPTADAVFVRRLLVSEARAVLQARTQITRPLFARIRIEAARRSTVARPRRLYISRRDSAKRQMVNELELEAALARRGFEIVTMTGRDLVEQIALVDGADTVVAPHGAGLALLAAARPGRKVFEIVPGMRAAMTIRTCMAHLSRMVGHHHCMWVERAPPAQMGRWSVSLAPALEFLDEFLDA